MRILNEEDVEIQEEDVDTQKGYLTPDKVLIKHHDAVEESSEEYHYYAETVYFKNGDQYSVSVEGECDPHIRANEDGVSFEYIPGEGEEYREVQGMDVKKIVDKEQSEAKDAWDEYEEIQRYKLYTEDELRQRAEQELEVARVKAIESQHLAFINLMAIPASMGMKDSEVEQFSALMPEFTPGEKYDNRVVVRHNGFLYRAIQAVPAEVTKQFTPDAANTYWKRIGEPNEEGLYPWTQPLGATDAYMAGDRVTYEDRAWTSDIDDNIWVPGDFDFWVEDGTKGEGGTMEWKQPIGAQDAYKKDARVTWKGKTWESLTDNNVWEPGAVGSETLWKEVI